MKGNLASYSTHIHVLVLSDIYTWLLISALFEIARDEEVPTCVHDSC